MNTVLLAAVLCVLPPAMRYTHKCEAPEPKESDPMTVVATEDGYEIRCPDMRNVDFYRLQRRLLGKPDFKGFYCYSVRWRRHPDAKKVTADKGWYGVFRYKRDTPISELKPCEFYLRDLRSRLARSRAE